MVTHQGGALQQQSTPLMSSEIDIIGMTIATRHSTIGVSDSGPALRFWACPAVHGPGRGDAGEWRL